MKGALVALAAAVVLLGVYGPDPPAPPGASKEQILLIDGECCFCNSVAQFIIERDPWGKFKFASQQSKTGEDLMHKHGLVTDLTTVVLVDGDNAYVKSEAILRVLGGLPKPWSYLYMLNAIPKVVADPVYDLVSRLRYSIAGRKSADTCTASSSPSRDRFLD
eukprot:TRINITY_DN2826_c0_g1_i2.p1 TRINITY_DN2826_c0_g1~~TRINITY_DN2826_c0_g1_i2.p1  ORF type:complete len:162 (+),score=37.18 TRINITY_DN2826_c0_g1_i2:3-488(+)